MATAMVLCSTVSVQCGAALGTTLFDAIGPAGANFVRSVFGALALTLLARGRLALGGKGLRDVALFGLALAAMGLCIYGAFERLPLGIAVTLEFVGPLGVAVAGSRRRRDLFWVALAAAGIMLLSDGLGGGGIDGLGALLALAAGGFWAVYIVMSARVGRNHPGLEGVAAATALAALVLAPVGIAAGGADLLSWTVVGVGLGVGLLSAAVPYALELQALRRLPKATFGVLMSLEPAVAAAVGFLALSQGLALHEIVGIALVVCACAGALRAQAGLTPRDV